MGSVGFPEIVVIFLLALLVFGPKKLPEIGRSLGNAIREFRKATKEFTSSIEELEIDEKLDVDIEGE